MEAIWVRYLFHASRDVVLYSGERRQADYCMVLSAEEYESAYAEGARGYVEERAERSINQFLRDRSESYEVCGPVVKRWYRERLATGDRGYYRTSLEAV